MGNKSSLLLDRNDSVSGERRDRSWSFTGNMNSPTLSGLKGSRHRTMSLSQHSSPARGGQQRQNSISNFRMPRNTLNKSSPQHIRAEELGPPPQSHVYSSSMSNVNHIGQSNSLVVGSKEYVYGSRSWRVLPHIQVEESIDSRSLSRQNMVNWSGRYSMTRKMDLQKEKRFCLNSHRNLIPEKKRPNYITREFPKHLKDDLDLENHDEFFNEGFRPRTNSTSVIEMNQKGRSRVVMGAASANLRRKHQFSPVSNELYGKDSGSVMQPTGGAYLGGSVELGLYHQQDLSHEQQNLNNEQLYLRGGEFLGKGGPKEKLVVDEVILLPSLNDSPSKMTPKNWKGKKLPLPDIHEEKILSSSVPNCSSTEFLSQNVSDDHQFLQTFLQSPTLDKFEADFLRKRSHSISNASGYMSRRQQMSWNIPHGIGSAADNREILIHYSPFCVRKFAKRSAESPTMMTLKPKAPPPKERAWNYSMSLGDSCPNLLDGSSDGKGSGFYQSQNKNDPDAIRNLKNMEGYMDSCPSCHLPFDKGKKRRLIDSCGHERCYSCMFDVDKCPLCDHVANSDKPNGHFSRQSSTESGVFNQSRPKLKTNGHFTTYMQTRMDISPASDLPNPLVLQPPPNIIARNNTQQPAAAPRFGVVPTSKPKIVKSPLLTSPPVPSPTPPPLPPKNYPYNELGIPKHYSSDSALGSPDVSSVSVSVTTDDIDELPELEGTKSELNEETENAGMPVIPAGGSPPPPPPDVAQNDLMTRLGLLLEELSSSEQIATGHKEGTKEEAFTSISSLTSCETTPDKGISDTSPMSTLTVSSGSEQGHYGYSRCFPHHHHHHHHHQQHHHHHHHHHPVYSNCTPGCPTSDSMSSLMNFTSGNGASPLSTMQRPHSITTTAPGPIEELQLFGKRKSSLRIASTRGSVGLLPDVRFTPIQPPQLKMFPIKFEVPHPEGKPLFIGREWLFKDIEMALNCDWSSQTQGVVLQGEVGSGKTAVIEQLIDYSCFGSKTYGSILPNGDSLSEANGKDRFRQNGYQSSPCGTLSSLSSSSVTSHNSYLSTSSASLNYDSLKSLACQVVAYHICQADNNVTCMLPDFVHSIAASLARAPQLEAYRELLLTDPNLFNILALKECVQNPYQSFVKGILEPLKQLKTSGKITSDSCIILIDSLNEAEFHRPDYGDTIGSFLLHYIHRFPAWLKVITSVRTNYADITRMLPFCTISIDTCDATQRDLHDYITYRINSNIELQNNIAPDETGTPNKFSNHLQLLSKGSFLYCKLVLDLIERGNLVLKSTNYKIIPINISEVFLLQFNLKFPSVRSFERVYPILGICLAALYPLSHEEIFEAVNSGATKKYISREEFSHRLEVLFGFLYHRLTDNTFMFFHPAFREWLIKRDENEHRKFLCELRYGHSLMAFRLSRVCSSVDSDKTLELGHHILKANIYKNLCRQSQFSSRVFLAYWMCLCSDNLNAALVSQRNLFSPNVKVSRLIMLAGANPNTRSNYLNQAPVLCVSAREGFIEMVSSLLEFNASVDATCEDGMTALGHAAANGHLDIIKLLCSKKANLSHTDKCGQCPAVHAAMHGHLDSLAFLLQCDWSSASSQQQKIEAMQQAFVAAAAMGHKHICDYLVIHAAGRSNEAFSIDAVDTLIGETALTAACLHGRKEVVQYLIKQGANVHLANTKSYSPLLCAVKGNKWDVAEILFQAGASIEQPDKNGHTPLMIAASEGHVAILEMLLSAEASQTEVDTEGMTSLCLACFHGHLQIVQILLSRGSDLHHTDNNGQTPLHLAAFYGEPQIVQYLIEQGANIEQVDNNNMRPLDRAITCKNVDVIMCFLKKGAKLSPATWNMASGKPTVLLVLLKKLMEDGNILYKRNRIKEAAQRFNYALKKFPKDNFSNDASTFRDLRVNLLLSLSKCKRKLQDCTAAIDLATKVLEISPKSFEGFYARARARRDNKQFENALEDLKQAVFLVPNNAELQRLLLRLRSECLELASMHNNDENHEISTKIKADTADEEDADNDANSSSSSPAHAAAASSPLPVVDLSNAEILQVEEENENSSTSSLFREETAL